MQPKQDQELITLCAAWLDIVSPEQRAQMDLIEQQLVPIVYGIAEALLRCQGVPSNTQIEDLRQEASLAFFKYLDGYHRRYRAQPESLDRLPRFLREIVTNKRFDALRQKYRTPGLLEDFFSGLTLDEAESSSAVAQIPDSDAGHCNDVITLRDFLDNLSLSEQIVLDLIKADWTNDKIAGAISEIIKDRKRPDRPVSVTDVRNIRQSLNRKVESHWERPPENEK